MSDYRQERREPNFEGRRIPVGPYVVNIYSNGSCQMDNGKGGFRTEPAMVADIWRDGRLVGGRVHLNSATLCLPGYSVRGVEATAEEIVRGILGDEDIFSGDPSFPAEVEHLEAL